MTEETTNDTEKQEVGTPDAILEISWNGEKFGLQLQRPTDLSHPAAHLADWIGRNFEGIASMAAVEWNLRKGWNEAVQQQMQALQQQLAQPEGDEKPEVEVPALRLVSPHGGPLN